jgi:diacylglycerol kinase (ATP)
LKHYALILNPMAGRGKGRKLAKDIISKVNRKLGQVEVFFTEYAGHAKQIAHQIKNDYSVIIVAGGDGTIHETVNGMINGKAVLSVIPIGSGNDFVRMLNIPRNIDEAIAVIQNGKKMWIDIGKIGDRYFPNGIGIGFDAWVVKESMKIKKLRGFMIYLYSVLKTVFSFKNEFVTFYSNGKTEQKNIFLIAVGNGKAMGGGFFLNPEAKINDGKFDVCIINALSKKEVFLNLPKAVKGAHTHLPQVTTLQTEQLKIFSDKGIAVHADGELLGVDLKEVNISILPNALEVIHN